jgi:response regulator of citrate/malate metabolism
MSSSLSVESSLSVLVVSSDGGQFGPGMLSGLRSHCSLFCRSVAQALESVPDFAPDLVLIDQNLADGEKLVSGLNSRITQGEIAVVQFSSAATPSESLPGVFRQLMLPVAESELASEILQIRTELESDRPFTKSSA